MNVYVDLYDAQNKKCYNKQLFKDIAQETIKQVNVLNGDITKITLSVAIVDEEEIQRVNKQLRSKNVVTDVISVGEYSDEKNISITNKSEIFLGEVILCYNFIEQVAQENNAQVDREFFTIYAHGVLHLLGFKHGEQMFQLQDAISKKFCYNK